MGRKLELSGQEESRESGMMSPAWNLAVEVAKLGDCLFKASIVYRVNSSAARKHRESLSLKQSKADQDWVFYCFVLFCFAFNVLRTVLKTTSPAPW